MSWINREYEGNEWVSVGKVVGDVEPSVAFGVVLRVGEKGDMARVRAIGEVMMVGY